MWTFEMCYFTFLCLFFALSGTRSEEIGVFTIPQTKMTSKQSTTCDKRPSSLAHDGNIQTFSCSISVLIDIVKAAWWEAKLHSRLKITGLETVAPRHKRYYGFLDNYEVYICNESLQHIKKISKCHLCSKSPYVLQSFGSTTRIKCKRHFHGNFVSIVKRSNRDYRSKILAIGEVRIFYNNIYSDK